MKGYICKYCAYKDKRSSTNIVCTAGTHVKNIYSFDKCPRGYTTADIDFIYDMEREDNKRYAQNLN